MENILIVALLTVVIVGIPLAIAIGYAASHRPRYVLAEAEGTTSEEPPKTVPIATAKPSATKRFDLGFLKSWSSWIMVLIIVLVCLVLWIFFRQYIGRTLFSGAHGLQEYWSAPFGFLLAAIFLIISWCMPKGKKRPLLIIGMLTGLVTLLIFGFLNPAATVINNVQSCAAYGDCGPRAGKFPVIKGGMVDVPREGTETFFAIGTVALRNHVGYCVNVSPPGVFTLREIPGAGIVYITAKSGKTELATVSSLHVGEEGCGQ